MDGKKWESFHYMIPGSSDFDNLQWGLGQIQNQQSNSDRSVVDHSAEDADSIVRFARMRGEDGLRVNRVEIVDADRMKWLCSIYEGDSKHMLFDVQIVFRGTGIGERPWLVTKIVILNEKSPRIGGSASSFLQSGKEKFDKKDYEGAIADYNKGLLWRPDNNDLLRNRGWAKTLKGDHDGAIADAASAIAHPGMYGDQEACLLYGFAKLQKGDYDGAIAQFDGMIERGEQKATAYEWRASAKDKKGDWDGAIADYRRAIDTDPKLKDELLPKIEKVSAKKNEPGQR
jgi:tetratricopeptide (TPR) repeat protein